MARIISFGKYKNKESTLRSFWSEILGLSTFTKLTIITIIAIVFALTQAKSQIQTLLQYAAPPISQESTALPANCHLAVDLTICKQKSVCHPTPSVVCDANTH